MVALLSASLFLFGCADDKAREQLADTNLKISQLEQSVGVLDNKVSNQKLLDILNKLDDLQNQINQINGTLATLQHNQQTFQDTQNQLDQEQQMQSSGSGDNNTSAPATNVVKTQQSDSSPDKMQLKAALKKIKSRNFNDAIKQLRNLSSSSKNTEVLATANYYLTIAYAANGEYKNSIWIARKFINANPKNPNVPDALYTMYISQQQLGMKKSAANTAALLKKNYPNSSAAKKVR